MKKYYYCILLMIILLSCESVNEPTNNFNYSIIGNLVANSTQQEMYIYKTIPLDFLSWNDIPHPDNNYLVKNANIVVTDENNISHSYTLSLDTNVYYYVSNFDIKPHSQYKLKISIEGKEVISGITNVPDDFSIISPLPNQHFTQKNDTVKIPVVWNTSKNSFGYKVNIFFNNGINSQWRENSFILQDTSFTYIALNMGRGTFKIDITAFDKNIYENVIEEIPSAGIKGAYGYFGASVLKSVTVNIN